MHELKCTSNLKTEVGKWYKIFFSDVTNISWQTIPKKYFQVDSSNVSWNTIETVAKSEVIGQSLVKEAAL